jgi:hypothetical protein
MSSWPSSAFAVDYHPKTRIKQENEERFPPRYRLSPWPTEQDFDAMTAKHGRPIGPFEKDRRHSYRVSRSSIVASSTETP